MSIRYRSAARGSGPYGTAKIGITAASRGYTVVSAEIPI
jgi:hypothetical protein